MGIKRASVENILRASVFSGSAKARKLSAPACAHEFRSTARLPARPPAPVGRSQARLFTTDAQGARLVRRPAGRRGRRHEACEIVLGGIRGCWRRVINSFKKAAIRSSGPKARSAYVEFCGLLGRISGMGAAPEPVRDAVLEKALAVAAGLPEGHPARAEMENAGKNPVTLLKFKGMPPTNNPGESGIRRGPVARRNVRHRLRTEEGARIFSAILSFILTCDKQGVPLDEAFIALAGGADPADIFKVGQVAPNRWGSKAKKPRRPGRGPLDSLVAGAAAPAPAAGAATAPPLAPCDNPAGPDQAEPRRAGHAAQNAPPAQKAPPAPPAQKAPPAQISRRAPPSPRTRHKMPLAVFALAVLEAMSHSSSVRRKVRLAATPRAAPQGRPGAPIGQGRRAPLPPEVPRSRHPPKPPPQQHIRLRISPRRRPHNGHIPIGPSVPLSPLSRPPDGPKD